VSVAPTASKFPEPSTPVLNKPMDTSDDCALAWIDGESASIKAKKETQLVCNLFIRIKNSAHC
jgi:hypothetical protein